MGRGEFRMPAWRSWLYGFAWMMFFWMILSWVILL